MTTPVTVQVRRWPEGHAEDDVLAPEVPLEIRIEGEPLAITMRTPGHDLELAAGFLYTEGVIDGPDDLMALAHVDDPGDPQGNTIDVVLASGLTPERVQRARREPYASSACGVCGKASIDQLLVRHPPLSTRLEPDPALLATLPDKLRQRQDVFAATGGLHGAALVDLDGDLEVCREDIGRHNAVDKVLGYRLLADAVPVDDRILLVSGRVGFEIVQKALVGGVPFIAAVGAPSSLAVALAREAGLGLVGFLSARRFNRYA